MLSGQCWLSVEGIPDPVLLTVGGGVGWLFALADKQMSAAITCMYDDPGNLWTLQKLAERVGMSRSIFALRFKETVGATPSNI